MSKAHNFIDMTGQKLNRLTVIKRVPNPYGRKDVYWLCKCDCGNEVTVIAKDLRSGHTKSCGCLAIESRKQNRLKHGESDSRLFRIWWDMKRRCTDDTRPHWKDYGGRGIKVCDEWQEFLPFYEWAMANGYADNLTIDRINNDGDYEPLNCRWTTYKEQANNTRRNHLITYNGETHNLTQWSEITGISQRKLIDRLGKLNWSVERAFEGWCGSES